MPSRSRDGPEPLIAQRPQRCPLDVNVLIRGQSNALMFSANGGPSALEAGLEATLGVNVNMLYQWGTDTSTIWSGTAFMDWDTDGEQASLLRYVDGLSADVKDNP